MTIDIVEKEDKVYIQINEIENKILMYLLTQNDLDRLANQISMAKKHEAND